MPKDTQTDWLVVTDGSANQYKALTAFRKADPLTEVEGYVWCEQRGAIHDTTVHYQGSVKRHGGVVFYDIFEDGELCNEADHKPLYTTGEID